MLKLPNLELLEYIAKQCFFSKEENKNLYIKKTEGFSCRTEGFFRVEMFPQTWGSTALGFDVDENGVPMMGGSMMTEVYTIVFFEPFTETYLVFFGDKICYQVQNANEEFLYDLKHHQLKSLSKAKLKY